MRVTVRYLGAFAEVAHSKEAAYELASPSVETLMDYLLKMNGEKFRIVLLNPESGKIRGGITLLVNGRRVGPQHELSDDDEVTLLTPLAGG